MVLPIMANIKPMYLSRDALSALWPLEEKLQKGAGSGTLAAAIAYAVPMLCPSATIRSRDWPCCCMRRWTEPAAGLLHRWCTRCISGAGPVGHVQRRPSPPVAHVPGEPLYEACTVA